MCFALLYQFAQLVYCSVLVWCFCVRASGFGLSVTLKMGGGILIFFDTKISLYETMSRTVTILIPQMVWSNKEVKGDNCMCPDS